MASEITLDEKFLELLNARKPPKNSRPKIQKVPQNLRNRNKYDKEYLPKAVSIGPIHHDNKNLKMGDNHKLTLAAKYAQKIKQSPQFLHKKIADNISELKDLFADDVLALANNSESLQGFRSLEEKLSWLLFVDGCFLLYFLGSDDILLDDDMNIHHMNIDVAENIEAAQVFIQAELVIIDVLLWKNDNENELIEAMVKFLINYDWAIQDNESWRRPGIREKLCTIFQKTKKEPFQDEPEPPIHLLDLRRKLILTKSNPKVKKEMCIYANEWKLITYMNIEDLIAIGIKLKSSKTRRPLDVDFSEDWFTAALTLPEIVMRKATISSFLNLTAYEMCPDFENNYGICSFVVFMDTLIDHAEDVKKLRSEGILGNSLGRDEEVVDLFNIISTDLKNNPFIYYEVKAKIHEYRFKKCKIWLALGYHTYFRNPWAFIGFLGAVIALVLTFLQTWFSINPR